MKILLIRLFTVVALAITAAVLPAAAAPLKDVDAAKVRGVIVAQLTAFAQDDADSAFQTASPAVQEAIGSSGRFLAMVRGAYPMVYRATSVNFHIPQVADGRVLQMVEITDGDAKPWLAVYTLERQADNSWRISGCKVMANRWKSI